MAEYKINVQKSIIFLHTGNEQFQSEIKKTFHLQYHQKNKILRSKSNRRGTRLVYGKLQNSIEKSMAKHWSKFIKTNFT